MKIYISIYILKIFFKMSLTLFRLIIQLTIFIKTIYSDSYEFRSNINGDILLTCNKTCVKIQYIDDTIDCLYPTSKLTKDKEIKDVKIICSYESNCDFQYSCSYHTYNYKLFDYYCRNKNKKSELNICNGLGLGKINNKIYKCNTICSPYDKLSLDSGILKDEVKYKHVFLNIFIIPTNTTLNYTSNKPNLLISKNRLKKNKQDYIKISSEDIIKDKKYNLIIYNKPEIWFIVFTLIYIIILKIALIREIYA
jgi:hypothetical protein